MMTTEPASHAALADAGELEHHRAALARHCRRMLGSSAEADDAVQETMMRGWRARDRFEDGSSLSTWLYHIATNVCFDALRRRRRHAVAVDFGPGATHSAARVAASGDGPAELAERSDNIRLAFVVALRRLPPTQRVAVILHDVFRWKANEVAALLDTSAPAVNSALQRAAGDAPSRRCRGAGCRRRRAAAQPRPSRRRLRPERRDPARDVVARRRRRRRLNVGWEVAGLDSTSVGSERRFGARSRHVVGVGGTFVGEDRAGWDLAPIVS